MNPAAETEAVRTLLSRGIDGLMLVGAERAQETVLLLRSGGLPVVLTWVGTPEFAAVTVDNELAGRMAARHLIRLGHKRIGMIVGHLPFNDRQRGRLSGVRNEMLEAGLALPDSLVSEQGLTMAGGRAGCARLLDLGERPTAVIGGIDLFAIGCIQEAQSRGIGVPEAFSVVGIDDIEMAANMTPSLTTVHVPTSRIGQTAAATLLAEIRGESARIQTMLPIELIERRSSGRTSNIV
jgi:LacI family transcriptional regulator